MALRNMRTGKDSILRKRSKEVKVIDKRILTLIDDMIETMEHHGGVGLAAVQVGALKRVVVINTGDEENKNILELINPKIVEMSGSQKKSEACLSLPGRSGLVERPLYVKVKARNRDDEEFIVEGEGFLAIALCHETDHLDGILYTDKMIEEIFDDDEDEEQEGYDEVEGE